MHKYALHVLKLMSTLDEFEAAQWEKEREPTGKSWNKFMAVKWGEDEEQFSQTLDLLEAQKLLSNSDVVRGKRRLQRAAWEEIEKRWFQQLSRTFLV
jgi:hypothetical protein